MEIWFTILILSAAVAAVLVFGTRQLARAATGQRGEADLAIYRDQLAELDRDAARGLVAADAVAGQRTEIARRLLAAANEVQPPSMRGTGGYAIWTTFAVPVLAIVIYGQVGSPGSPDVPLAQRLEQAEANGDIAALVAKVENHLAQKPDDAAGWKLLIPNYFGMGRYADAATAIGRLIALEGPSTARLADLAEALTLANQGMVAPDAARIAADALALDPKNQKARFYEALGLSQDGKPAEALQRFEALLADAPPDAPWRAAVVHEIAKLKGQTLSK